MNDTISNNIHDLRISMGVSKYRVALNAGLTQTHYQRIEEGSVTPRLDTARRIAAALGSHIDDLWPVENE